MSDIISNFRKHPQSSILSEYRDEPEKTGLTVRLDYLAWGNSRNLFCYFSDCHIGKKYTLSVFANNGYRPYNGGDCFKDTSLLGGIFEIDLETSKNGKIKLTNAIQAGRESAIIHKI